MASAAAFLSPEKYKTCYACGKRIKQTDKSSTIKEDGIVKFGNKAKEWEKIKIPDDIEEYNFTLVAARLKGKTNYEEVVLH